MLAALTAAEDGFFLFTSPRPSPPLYWFVPKAGKHVNTAKSYPMKKIQKFCTKLLNSLPKSFKMKEDRRVYFFGVKMNEYSFKGEGRNFMVKQIRKAAVIGSGVMGSGIAAHLANIGIPILLLDIVPKELTDEERKKGLTLEDPDVRNRLARKP